MSRGRWGASRARGREDILKTTIGTGPTAAQARSASRRGRSVVLGLAATALVFTTGCHDDGADCCAIEPEAFAVLQVQVQDAAGDRLGNANVQALVHVSSGSEPLDFESRTDAEGRALMTLVLSFLPVGDYDVDLVIRASGSEVADTLGPWPVRFDMLEPARDTTRLVVWTRW